MAARELLRRRAIRGNLTEWARACGFEPAPHHALIIDRLTRLIRREYRRLFVFVPPGAAKSTYGSIVAPPWYLAQAGASNVIAASHTVTLAERFARKVRNIVNEHSHELGFGLSGDSTAAGRWETDTGKEYLAAGVGTGIAGFRAGLGIIDDPVASREDADSERKRIKTWEWYNDDFSNRLTPGALELIIMTRWHEDDLAGRLLARDDGVATHVLSLPAEAGADDALGRKPGEFLWEGEYGYAERLREKKAAYLAANDKRSWASMFQQNPVPDEGLFLEIGRIQRVRPPPISELRIIAASDYATSDGSGDFTVHGVAGLDEDDNLHVLDWWRRQTTTDVWIDQIKSMTRSWSPIEWGEEAGVIQKAVAPQLDRVLATDPKTYLSRVQYPSINDKPTRARALQARMNEGKICISPDAYWAEELIAELARFPAATYDDQTDTLAMLATIAASRGPPKKKKSNLFGSASGGGGSFFGG